MWSDFLLSSWFHLSFSSPHHPTIMAASFHLTCKAWSCPRYLCSIVCAFCSNFPCFIFVCSLKGKKKNIFWVLAIYQALHLKKKFLIEIYIVERGFPGGSVVKNLPANAGDVSLIPRSGRSPGEGSDNLLQYSCLGNSTDRGAGRLHIPWGCKRVWHSLVTKQHIQLNRVFRVSLTGKAALE